MHGPNKTDLQPNLATINMHLNALFDPAFVHLHPDSWIEIPFAKPGHDLSQAKIFSAFKLEEAASFAFAKNAAGFNVYVGVALRQGKHPRSGRANKQHFLSTAFAWLDHDQVGDNQRIADICKREQLEPAIIVITGTVPDIRAHVYFALTKPVSDVADVEEANKGLKTLLGSDNVVNADRVLRLAGTVNYPPPDKAARGYIPELTTIRIATDPTTYSTKQLQALGRPTTAAATTATSTVSVGDDDNAFIRYGNEHGDNRLDDAEIAALLNRHSNGFGEQWHKDLLAVTLEMLLRGCDPFTIRLAIGSACKRGATDKDIAGLVDKKYAEFQQREREAEQVDEASSPTKFLTLDQWRQRDLPTPDYLLGDVLHTASRALLAAPTGLGKTNFAIATGMRMSAGLPFLNWQGRRAAKVLYIDGEMSRRLLRERLLAEEARLLNEVGESVRDQFKPTGFRALSSEDIPDFKPLDTRRGQQAIEKIISEIGGCDFIIFDNVMSLIAGSMVDEEAWAKTMPWVRSLTKRSIGQLWVHHANDQNLLYGTKTRAWQMDTVVLLSQVQRDDSDISFELAFWKARERTPTNRDDFRTIGVYLSRDDQWTCDGAQVKSGKLTPTAHKFLQAMINVVGSAPTSKSKRLHGQHAVHAADWKAECERLALLDPQGPANIQRALFSKYRRELVAANKIACEGEHSWLL